MVLRSALFILIVASCSVVVTARAQDNNPDEHAATCHHEEFVVLDFLEGEWAVSGSVRLPDGEWKDVTGSSTIESELDGCILIERYHDDRADETFSALAIFSHDPIDNRLQKTWIDSAHGMATWYRGGPVESEIIFSASKEIRGTLHHFVEEYEPDGRDRFVVQRRRSTGDRRAWRATSRIEYVRE
ncbi:MAG: DUF1579 family protein [Rhodothermales bacterium]|nr:DUF1579 family protein [Rhodothermales bacterium]